MITLKLKSGDVLKFNLKNPKREQKLRDAWYSMEDTPRFGSKKLRIRTDCDKTLDYEVKDVKDCVYEEGVYDYSADVPEDTGPSTEKMTEDFYERMKEIMPLLDKHVQEVMDHIPEENKQKACKFLTMLEEQGITMDFTDSELYETVQRVMHDDESHLQEHLQAYMAHWKKRQK